MCVWSDFLLENEGWVHGKSPRSNASHSETSWVLLKHREFCENKPKHVKYTWSTHEVHPEHKASTSQAMSTSRLTWIPFMNTKFWWVIAWVRASEHILKHVLGFYEWPLICKVCLNLPLSGVFPPEMKSEMMGPLCHSRWFTTASRILRLYVSGTCTLEMLPIFVNYIVNVYVQVIWHHACTMRKWVSVSELEWAWAGLNGVEVDWEKVW